MKILHSVAELRAWRQELPQLESVGFVPTMGALHAGHISLVTRAVTENDRAVASIFVNPTQFGPNEDLDRYPRTPEADIELLKSAGVAALFMPADTGEIYPDRSYIRYAIDELDERLCGARRPGHFDGVLQVVTILFHLVQPTKAYFGLKDFQQFFLLRRMVQELHFPTQLIGCPIVRESDGLAMSSRNRYLSPSERRDALLLYQTLTEIRDRIQKGEFQTVTHVKAHVREKLAAHPHVQLDYFDILSDQSLAEPARLDAANQPRAFMAAYVGNTRLIDNMSLYKNG